MSAQLMGLVRELKALNARKKAGEELSAPEETRRKELKTFLKAQLEGPGTGAEEPSVSQPRPEPAAAARPAPTAVPPPRPPSADMPAPRPVSIAQPPPKPFVPKKDVYAIAGADAFIEAAASSDAVKKTDGWAKRSATASDGDIADAEAAADAAIRATNKHARVTTPEDVEAQLKEIGGTYTPPETDYVLEQYYGDYLGEGLSMVSMGEAGDLKPIDPREIQFRQALDIAVGSGPGATTITVPPGLVFIDDFLGLYQRRVLNPPGEGGAGADVDDPALLIGRRKVTVHLLNGEKKQGSVKELRRGELGMRLEVRGGIEEIGIAQVKAVFVHLQPNAQQVSPGGRSITVLFRDQRAVQGESIDYEPHAPVFSLVPPSARGQFEKIVINAAAVLSVT